MTTQYVARLGETVPELNVNDTNVKIFDKTLFSMLTPKIYTHLVQDLNKPKSVILCGIEAHVCVMQTCLDLLSEGYDVHVVSDAVSSSTAFNRSIALEVIDSMIGLAYSYSMYHFDALVLIGRYFFQSNL